MGISWDEEVPEKTRKVKNTCGKTVGSDKAVKQKRTEEFSCENLEDIQPNVLLSKVNDPPVVPFHSEPDENISRARRCLQSLNKHSGTLYGLVCGLTRAWVKLIEKDLTYRLRAVQILLARSVFQGLIIIIMKPILKLDLRPINADIKYLACGCILHSSDLILSYVAFSYINYYECMIFIFGTGAVSSIFVSKCFLSEPVSLHKICSTIIICCGLFMTAQPNLKFDNLENWFMYVGILAAIGSGIAASIAGATISPLTGTSPLAVVFYFSISNVMIGGLGCLIQLQKGFNVTLEDAGKSLLVGVLGVTLNALFARGIQTSNYVEVFLATEIDIPAGLVLQIIVFHDTPKPLSIVGGMTVLIGIISIPFEKFTKEKLCHCFQET
ncbi:hypothetical protein GQR58_015986 [Nymphon striatum]|nr:hypothetical protein GQR58_015986 [Nymphon striatum]